MLKLFVWLSMFYFYDILTCFLPETHSWIMNMDTDGQFQSWLHTKINRLKKTGQDYYEYKNDIISRISLLMNWDVRLPWSCVKFMLTHWCEWSHLLIAHLSILQDNEAFILQGYSASLLGHLNSSVIGLLSTIWNVWCTFIE